MNFEKYNPRRRIQFCHTQALGRKLSKLDDHHSLTVCVLVFNLHIQNHEDKTDKFMIPAQQNIFPGLDWSQTCWPFLRFQRQLHSQEWRPKYFLGPITQLYLLCHLSCQLCMYFFSCCVCYLLSKIITVI